MHKSVRQSMAWLHSWIGLLFGWLLFAIFLTGSVTYYRQEISLWMQPQFASMQVNQQTAVETAVSYLQKNAPDAKSWYIGVANQSMPVNKIYWQKADGGYDSKTLDAATGKEMAASTTQGGDFFYSFHFQLYGVPYYIGRLITTIAAFIMLITLISGVITHKKILTDFFTLRAFKGQRSYLDFHNVSAVVALPFFLTITFTGLAIFFYVLLPSGMKKIYPDNPFQYFEEIRTTVTMPHQTTINKAEMKSIHYFLNTARQQWGNSAIENITIQQPNTTQSRLTITELKDQSITRNQAQITFNAANGKMLGSTRNTSAIATLNAGVYGLHMAKFAQPALRLGFFFSGILGCAMIASGLLLWSLKRQMQRKSESFHLGHYVVNRLNIAAILGLPLSMLAYLYANRVMQGHSSVATYEVYAFFGIWLSSLITSLVMPQRMLWKMQLKFFILGALLLPIINIYYLISHGYIHSWAQYWTFLRVDLMILIFGLLALFLHQNIVPIQQRAVDKIKRKQQAVLENI